MGIESNINLIVASLDLQLVRLLRGAMAGGGATPLASRAIPPRPRVAPEPLIEPRRRITPEPRIEPRIVLRPQRVAELPDVGPPGASPPPPVSRSPIEPPWRMLPWEQPPGCARTVKIVVQRPDIVRKGTLVDFYI